MINEGKYFVSKKTASYSDTLLALGLASLLFEMSQSNVEIRDVGDKYEIKVSGSITNRSITPGYPYIRLESDNFTLPSGWIELDYLEQRRLDEVYKEFKRTSNAGKEKASDIVPNSPDNFFKIAKVLNSMRKGFKSDINLAQFLANHQDNIFTLAKTHLTRFSASAAHMPPNTQLQIDTKLQKLVTTSQFFNPASGKGINRPKPDSTALAGYPKALSFWFDEWMKFRGAAYGLLGFFVDKDIKIMVISPADISITQLQDVHKELLGIPLWGGTLTIEVKATLNLAKLLIQNSTEFKQAPSQLSFLGRKPSAIIKGLAQAYFKSLGTAPALMNSSFIGLPGWFNIKDHSDAVAFTDILDEHELCLQSLDERKSSDVPILQSYRDFLSSGNISDFLNFQAMFASHIIRRRDTNRWVKQFTTTNLRRLFMDEGLKKIVGNEGFLNIATAIRKATVTAQYLKKQAKGGRPPFEIHYGLAQRWKQAVQYSDRFVTELCDFIQKYNSENAKLAEQGKMSRKNVTTADLNEVIELIQENSSQLVGLLLLAYGYAREPKEETPDEVSAQESLVVS